MYFNINLIFTRIQYHKPHPQSISRLSISYQDSIDSNTVQNITEDVDTKLNLNVSETENIEPTVKLEDAYSDDDRSLIDIRNEKKKVQKKCVKKEKKGKVKKRKKQEVMYEEVCGIQITVKSKFV